VISGVQLRHTARVRETGPDRAERDHRESGFAQKGISREKHKWDNERLRRAIRATRTAQGTKTKKEKKKRERRQDGRSKTKHLTPSEKN